jgi:hypothetical protein
MRKLGARNRVEIAMWAYETGRVQTEDVPVLRGVERPGLRARSA